MITLTEFLLARIAEDQEEIENARLADAPEWWMPEHWNRERSLAECEAKRRIVELHADDEPICMGDYVAGLTHRQVIEVEAFNGVPVGYCDTLRALGSVYAGHPDFRKEWMSV